MQESVFIYALVDPRDQRIRYVGKAVDPYRRVNGHRRGIWTEKHDHKTNWLRELGNRPDVIILEAVSQATWEERERFWIAALKEAGHPLTNWTPGGEGFTEETSRRVLTAEVRAEISRKSKERWQDPAWREMILARRKGTLKGIPKSPEHRRKIAEMNKARGKRQLGENNPFYGRSHTEEARKKDRESALKRMNDPARRVFVEENCRKMRETWRLQREIL